MDAVRHQESLRQRVLEQPDCSCPQGAHGTGRERDLACIVHGTAAMNCRRAGWKRKELDSE